MKQPLGSLIAAFALGVAACTPSDHGPTEPEHRENSYAFEKISPFSQAATVRLFVESGRDARGYAILGPKGGRLLTQSEKGQLDESFQLRRLVRHGEEAAASDGCFVPHHFFHYFDGQGQKVGEIAVCFCCEGVGVESFGNLPRIAGKEGDTIIADFAKLKSLVSSMGERTDIECHIPKRSASASPEPPGRG